MKKKVKSEMVYPKQPKEEEKIKVVKDGIWLLDQEIEVETPEILSYKSKEESK